MITIDRKQTFSTYHKLPPIKMISPRNTSVKLSRVRGRAGPLIHRSTLEKLPWLKEINTNSAGVLVSLRSINYLCVIQYEVVYSP